MQSHIQMLAATTAKVLCRHNQVDYLTAWLALAAPPERVDIAAAAGATRKYSSVADKHWAARWAELRAAVAEAGATVPAGEKK